MLEELGLTYELAPVSLAKGEHKQPDYLDNIHPHGLVPAMEASLEDTRSRVIESAAICMHLADTNPTKHMAPSPGTRQRAYWYQWIVYAVANLDEALIPMLFHTTLLAPEQRKPEPVENGKKVWATAGPFLSQSVEGRQWLLDHFSAADVVVGYDLQVASKIGLLAGFPPLEEYFARLSARPAYKKVFGA